MLITDLQRGDDVGARAGDARHLRRWSRAASGKDEQDHSAGGQGRAGGGGRQCCVLLLSLGALAWWEGSQAPRQGGRFQQSPVPGPCCRRLAVPFPLGPTRSLRSGSSVGQLDALPFHRHLPRGDTQHSGPGRSNAVRGWWRLLSQPLLLVTLQK